jgi:ATP-binding protein involved in chromosome partitioning
LTTYSSTLQRVAARAADFARKSNIRVLGVIENMSGFTCTCGERHQLFGAGGGRALSESLDVPLLAEIDLDPRISEGADHGEPAVLHEHSDGVLHQLAERILTDVAPPAGSIGCSARMLDAINRAVESAT